MTDIRQTAMLFTDRTLGIQPCCLWQNNRHTAMLSKWPNISQTAMLFTDRTVMTGHYANSHTVYWQNISIQPHCLMTEHYWKNSHAVYWQNISQTATLFTDRTLGKQPRCLMTEHYANSHAVYWQNFMTEHKWLEGKQTKLISSSSTLGNWFKLTA